MSALFTSMTEYRPCPTYRPYEATAFGDVRRIGSKKPLGRHGAAKTHHKIGPHWIDWRIVVADAWPEGVGRPPSSYPDGRVLTVAEWRAERLNS